MAALAQISLPALVANRTINVAGAALLWAFAARRASFLVASAPRLAGKTTLLRSLVDLVPPLTRVVVLEGMAERFAFLEDAEPARTMLVAEEFSDHMPEYIWGENTRKVFEAAERGYGVCGTAHAATAQQALAELAGQPHLVPAKQLALLHAVVTVAVWRNDDELVRRVHAITVVHPTTLQPVAYLDEQADELITDTSASGLARLGERLQATGEGLRLELQRRQDFLQELLREGVVDPEEVRKRAGQFPGGAGS